MGFVVGGRDIGGPHGVNIKNFREGSFRFNNGRRRSGVAVNELVLHETVTQSAQATIDVLKQRGLGVHLIIDPRGDVTQHADLYDDVTWHGSQHNGPSVGIELVNPYEPRFMPKGGAWATTINASWAAGGKYVVPTLEQAEAQCLVVDWLTSAASAPLCIPQLWPGLQHTQRLAMGRLPTGTRAAPGIHAHTYWDHADGAWSILYCWLRLEAGLSQGEAYAEAIRRATGASSGGVDLSDYFAQNPYLQA